MGFYILMKDVELKDDDTDKGGVAFKGETLGDFIREIDNERGTPKEYTLNEINNMLEDCGIETLGEQDIIIKLV